MIKLIGIIVIDGKVCTLHCLTSGQDRFVIMREDDLLLFIGNDNEDGILREDILQTLIADENDMPEDKIIVRLF